MIDKQVQRPEFYEISKWQVKEWLTTIGTRNKFIVEDPNTEKLYFFKESIERYPVEFWSEIIASKLGKQLGFDMLDYHIAVYNTTVGCLSELMVDQSSEELEHGITLIKKENPKFKITERPILLFSDIERSFFPYSGFIYKLIEVLVFDAIIGNQDRHSENWALIRSIDVTNREFNRMRLLKWSYDVFKRSGLSLKNIPLKKFLLDQLQDAALVNIRFAPIYDSGSSLCREIPENRIEELLKKRELRSKYVANGKAEITIDGKRINHFALLSELKKSYKEPIEAVVHRVLKTYRKAEISAMVAEIDDSLPKAFQNGKLSLFRKELIVEMIEERITFLSKLK